MSVRLHQCFWIKIGLIVGVVLGDGIGLSPLWAAVQQPSGSVRELSGVELFLKKDLEVEDLSSYSLFRALEERAKNIAAARNQMGDPNAVLEILSELALKSFAQSSADTLGGIFRALGRTEYSNSIVLGQAGVGKSFLIHQLVAMYGVGVLPDFMVAEVGPSGGAFESLREAYLGKTDVYMINMDLLSLDHTKKGQPWSTADIRMRNTLTALFTAAKKEFNRKDEQGKRVGRRSIFVIDEVATLPDLVQTTLKKILDETGFKNPRDPILSSQDCGYSVVAMTTPDEYRYMVKGDSAIERRYYKVLFSEISEAEALTILKSKSNEWTATYDVGVDEEALKLIIRMRRLLNSPPLAMPGSILAATNDLFLWKLKKGAEVGDPNPSEISLQDAKRFIVESYGLTELWFEGPNGEAPFQGLAEKVKERVIGQDEVVERIAARIQAWGRMGFGRDVPVFFLGGTSGSGKDTLIKTLNTLLFGHSGQHLMFSLGGIEGFGINSIIEGPPLGNHSDQSQGLLVQALENGPAQGMITFNEGKDAPSMELEKLKVFIESGEIRPKGRDARVRPIHFPIFILGQWGEELFLDESGKVRSDQEIDAIKDQLTQARMEEFFLAGHSDDRTGGVSRALLDRAKNTGGVFVLAPVSRKLLSKIAEIKSKRITEDLKKGSNIELKIESSVLDLIARHAELAGEGARAIEATTIDFTEGAINEAMNQGMPVRDQSLIIRVDVDSGGERLLILSEKSGKQWSVEVTKVRRIKLARDCANILNSN